MNLVRENSKEMVSCPMFNSNPLIQSASIDSITCHTRCAWAVEVEDGIWTCALVYKSATEFPRLVVEH